MPDTPIVGTPHRVPMGDSNAARTAKAPPCGHAEPVRLAVLALENAATSCRYHGTDFFFLGAQWGEPRCDSCKQPYRVTRALAALRPAPSPTGGMKP